MNKVIFASIAMDLKRVALGYHRGSLTMANRFLEEALKRKGEVDEDLLTPYMKKLLSGLERIKHQKDPDLIAEDALMYSTLFQNAAINL